MVRTNELAAWRKRRGINQEQAADAIGCKKNTYNLKENNKAAFTIPEVEKLILLLEMKRAEDIVYTFFGAIPIEGFETEEPQEVKRERKKRYTDWHKNDLLPGQI